MTADMVCASGVELLMDYLEGVLPPVVRADVDAHLAVCPRCVAFTTSYREAPRIFRQATIAAPPSDLGSSLREFLRRHRA